MRRLALGFALLATLPAMAVGVAAGHGDDDDDGHGTVWVTERLGSVTAFDARSGDVIWTQTVGLTPIGVVAPRHTGKVYSSDQDSNQMSVLDRRTGAILNTIPMGKLPHHLMASRDGRLVYVGEFGQNTVGVIDTAKDEKVAEWAANRNPDTRTHAVYITRRGDSLYTANTRADRTQPGDVAKLDARTGALRCNTPVGVDPSEILVVEPRETVGYVSVRGEDAVKVLDLTGPCPVLTGAKAEVGDQPDTLQLTPDGRTLVVTLRGTPAEISLVDTQTLAVTRVGIPGHTTTGHHWLSRDGRLTYVAVESPAGVAVIDNRRAIVVSDWRYPGGTRAHGVYYSPKGLR